MKIKIQETILLLCNIIMEKIKLDDYNFDRWLIFCWSTGTWKTYLAKSLLDKYIDSIEEEKRHKLDWYFVSDWMFKQFVKSNQLILRTSKDWEISITKFPLEMMTRSKLLIYDDIWVSDASDAYIRDLTFILDERIAKWFITIFTTNLNKEELQSKLNERIVSRMLYNSDIVVFKWEDRRLKDTKVYTI